MTRRTVTIYPFQIRPRRIADAAAHVPRCGYRTLIWFGMRRLATCFRDRPKIAGVEAGSPDEGAIDVLDTEQLRRVCRLNGAAVENPGGLALRHTIAQEPADVCMDLRHLAGRRRPAGADRPHRLVGDHQIGAAHTVRQRAFEL